ncbi:MAG: tetratricopeptide repeat protein, partial [Acidobacteria bacterium]|nr:tetratricopeptide repeat protein [Acidobacteriota bacterium]
MSGSERFSLSGDPLATARGFYDKTMQLNLAALSGFLLSLSFIAEAQIGVRGQIFLPNGTPLQRQTRFTLTTDDGLRTEIYFTDSNGRLAIPRMTGPYTITVESDGSTYSTTSASFNPVHASNYIAIHLKPVVIAPTAPPGTINVKEDQQISPKAREAYESALTLLSAKQYEQAIEPLKRAISIQPDYFRAHNDLGATYLKLNQLDSAIESFRRAIKIDGRNYMPRLNLGIALNRQNKFPEAAETLEKLHEDQPENPAVNPPLIEALIGSLKWVEAEKVIRKSLTQKVADKIDLQFKLGAVVLRQGKPDEAILILTEVVDVEPDYALAHLNLGASYLQSGNLEKAEAAL